MCGIAGQFNLQPLTTLESASAVLQGALRHRGPDDEGAWISPDQRVLLVQTRLAILDLSPAGHQPMVWEGEGAGEKLSVISHQSSVQAGIQSAVGSASGQQGTRNEEPGTNPSNSPLCSLLPAPCVPQTGPLENSAGASSTASPASESPASETLPPLPPAPCLPPGTPGLVIVFNGEIYNFLELRAELEAEGVVFRTRTDTEVILALYARDGVRCLDRLRGMYAFALWDPARQTAFLARDPLGIKPLYLCEGADGSLSFASELRALVQAGWCGTEIDPAGLWSFLRFGSVAEPGTMLKGVTLLPAGQALLWQSGKTQRWVHWSPDLTGPVPAPKPALTARHALQDSVRAHLVSDAPVGVFLSGGLDSTAMAVLAQQSGLTELKTFSIGFAETAFDERETARKTAGLLGAVHREWCLSAAEGKELIGGFVEALDQPSIDGLNTYCISKLAHEGGCKVVISGLGGDEMMGGYSSFQRVPKLCQIHRLLRWLPGARTLGSWVLRRNRNPVKRRMGEFLSGPGTPVHAWEACRSLFTAAEATALTTHLLGKAVPAPGPSPAVAGAGTEQDSVSVLELTRYMRNQLLRDSDVMSMRWGLELRTPLVDRQLFDVLGTLPAVHRLEAGKQLLADAVPEIPEHVRTQPKRGFTFPYAQWMEGEWMDLLKASGQGSPVPLTNWYQKWAVFIFGQWKHRLEAMKP